MADQKISELTALTGANVADDDAIAIVDTSATETKKIVFSELKNALDTATGFVRITGDTMTGALDVQSTITSDGLTVDNELISMAHTGNTSTISLTQKVGTQNSVATISANREDTTTSASRLLFNTNDGTSTLQRMRIERNGDISFYEDTGSTPKFFWDASAESLGIGTSSPSTPLHVVGNNGILVDTQGNGDGQIYFGGISGSDRSYLSRSINDFAIWNVSNGIIKLATNDTERMRIDNLGTLAVGTTHTNNWATFDGRVRVGARGILATTTASTQIGHNWYYDGGGSSGYKYIDSDYASRMIQAYGYVSWELAASGSQDAELTFDEKMRLDSSGVAINNSGQSQSLLSVGGGSTNAALRLRGSTGSAYAWQISSNAYLASALEFTKSTAVGGTTFSTPLMILDNSGNLLVGKTTIATGTAGIALRSNGEVRGTADGDYAARFSRLSSDGAIVGFEKDGAVVGSIGANSSKLYIGTGSANIRFRDDLSAILPTNADGSNSDADLDLGYSTVRWRDLYLSGSIEIENGSGNVGVGKEALNSNTASRNTAVGYQAGYRNTTASYNTFLGYHAGYENQTGDDCTYIGYRAGEDTTGEDNTFIGASAGTLITTGTDNTILGKFNGNQGGLDIRESDNNIVLADGDGNPAMHMAAFNTANDTTPATIRWGNYQSDGSGRGGQFYLDSAQSIWYNSTTGTSLRYHAQFRIPNGLVGHITTTGSSTAYSTSSDHRLKENVVDLTGATTRLKQLEPKRFNFIADADTTVDGFIAHEVQTVVPEAITGTHNEVDADGNPVYQGIDQSKLVPLLVATIKELEARITALENA